MADGRPPKPKFFLDEEKNNSFLRKLEEGRSHGPSDAERRSAAAIRAVMDEDDDDTEATALPRVVDAKERAPYVVDLGDQPNPCPDSAPEPDTFWKKLQTGWLGVEDRLAEWFGIDHSKYQWAVDEYFERQLAGDIPGPKANVEGLQLQKIQEQTMQRSLDLAK